ncbi:MAG: nucleotide sugar dehydrogenase, partial [Candidatus Saccharimonadales bacterium]
MSKTIAIVGLGYVGLPLALLTDEKDYEVIGIDLDQDKVDKINAGQSPIADKDIEEAIKKAGIKAFSDMSKISAADIVIVCVPTPIKDNYMPDLGPIKSACQDIAKHIKKKSLIIIESTINPGVCEEVIIPLVEKASKMTCGQDFFLAHCPERINPGDTKWSVRNIPRVLGSYDETGLKMALEFYNSIVDAEIKPMASLKEAEAVKVVENSFRDINIAFVNELAMSFSKLDINVENVINGAATKPFAFMAHYPGCGVGGHCIPVDPYYLIEYAKGYGFEHEFLSVARNINNQMPKFTVGLLVKALKDSGIETKSSNVAVLGIAYKPGVDDDRESPAKAIIKELESLDMAFSTYDPHIPSKSSVKSLEEALDKSDAVIIATGHKEFVDIEPEFFSQKGV